MLTTLWAGALLTFDLPSALPFIAAAEPATLLRFFSAAVVLVFMACLGGPTGLNGAAAADAVVALLCTPRHALHKDNISATDTHTEPDKQTRTKTTTAFG